MLLAGKGAFPSFLGTSDHDPITWELPDTLSVCLDPQGYKLVSGD
jgi:hypothetical protein